MPFDIHPEISKASTLPKEFYLNPQYFKSCLNNIFPESWQLVADRKNLQSNNIYPINFITNLLDESLVLINHNNEIKCFSNVCTHRANLITEKPCSGNKLRCMYHGRTFNLDGSYVSMPGFEETENFPTEKDNLKSIPVKNWKNFILVSLKNGIDIMPALKDIEKRLTNYPFDDLIHSKNSSQSWEIDAHWALYCENYLEGFHVPYVHKGLAKEIYVNTYNTILLENAVLQIAEGDKSYDVFKNIDTTDQNLYGLYYWIFPNLMLNFDSWGLSINIIEPISPKKTRIRFLSYPIKNNEQPIDGDDTLSKVEKEDQNVVLGVQKGIKSRFYSSGRYSPKHEKGIHHFHLLLDKYLT